MEPSARQCGPPAFVATLPPIVHADWDDGFRLGFSGETVMLAFQVRTDQGSRLRVVSIEDNLVRVKETYVDFRDRATTKEVEMRLYESQGG